jgi:predicted  nucleic acid-binding Zn-ribbon protein
MSVTAQLLKVYQVEKQIRSLQSRLKTAEGFLGQQVKELTAVEATKKALDTSLKTSSAQAAEREGEVKRLDAKLVALRERMENAQNTKEYQALLTELNTYKVEKEKVEATLLALMQTVETAKKDADSLATKKAEREQVKSVAVKERDDRHAEIEHRLTELKAELATYVVDVPKDTMVMFQRLLDIRGEEAMGPIEIVDRKRHEYNCGTCMMAVPMESVSGLLSSGKLTRCASCQCVLYITREDDERLRGGNKKGKD